MSMYGVTDTRITSGPGKAKQSMKDECDVNLIVARFTETGFMSHVSSGIPSFVDVSELTDYRSALEHVRSVTEYFAGFPAKVRAEFGNDAVAFMEYLESGATPEDLEALGREIVGDRRAPSRNRRAGEEPVSEEVATSAAAAAAATIADAAAAASTPPT